MRFKRLINRYIRRIRRNIMNMSRIQRRLYTVAIVCFALGTIAAGLIMSGVSKKKSEEAVAKVTQELTEENKKKMDALQKELDKSKQQDDGTEELPWYLTLVNYANTMEEGYVPTLTDLKPNYSVDSRIADAANQMLRDAEAAGLKIVMCSAYRSVERQEQLFNDKVKENINKGMSYWDAFEDARLSVAEPGTSEHALGLALDLISFYYDELDEGQEQTDEAKWLAENCHKYGFILRYPPAKTAITHIIYEPWHYRYVGVEDATKIMELGITLEEYLEEYY